MPSAVRPVVPGPAILTDRPRHAVRHAAAAGLLTGGLLWLSFFPVAWGWLAWVALVPWLMLVRAELPRRRRYLIAWLSALVFFVPALSWMRVASDIMRYAFWPLLALYCSWYFLFALWLLRRVDRRTGWPLTLTVPAVWATLELIRGQMGGAWSNYSGGFAWYYLGHTQHDYLPVIQIADLTGVAGITVLVAAVNGLFAEVVSRIPAVRGWFGLPTAGTVRLRPQVIGVALALVGALAYGGWRLSQHEFAIGPQVALLQTKIYQGDRNAADEASVADELARGSIDEQTRRLNEIAARRHPRPDLVIWPETTFTHNWVEVADGAPVGEALDAWRQGLAAQQQWARNEQLRAETDVLLGLNTEVYRADGRVLRYNSALLISPRDAAVQRYDKMHRVPFGEYIPLRDTLPWLNALSPYDFDYSLTVGDGPTRFHLSAGGREFSFGVLICYEDSDAPLACAYVRPGAGEPVNFLVDISNDGWFMETAEHAEHLAISRFRAVECRRSLVRAVNGGISAVVDGNGRVVALPAADWSASQAVPGVVSAAVPIDERTSVYARLGDWLPYSCGIVLLAGCFWRRRKP